MNESSFYDFADKLIEDDSAGIISDFFEQDSRRYNRALTQEQEASVK